MCVCVPVCVVVLLLLAGCTILVTPLLTSRVKGWSWQMKTTSYSTSQLSCNTEVLFPNTYSVVGLGCPRITSPPLNQKNRGVNARARNRSLCPLAASTQNSSTLFVGCKFCLSLSYGQPPNPLVCHSPSGKGRTREYYIRWKGLCSSWDDWVVPLLLSLPSHYLPSSWFNVTD